MLHHALGRQRLDAARFLVVRIGDFLVDGDLAIDLGLSLLGPGGRLGGRPYDESHKEAAIKRAEKDLLAARERVEGAVTDQAAARKKLRAAEKMSADAEKALAEHRDSMTDVSAESDKLRNLQREMQLIEATEDEVKRAGERARDLGERFKSEKASKNPFLDMIEESEKGLEDLDDDENIARSTLADAKQAEKYAQAVSDVYAPNGVRAFRLDEATPFLNSRTAHTWGASLMARSTPSGPP